jgi:hypothetical protein
LEANPLLSAIFGPILQVLQWHKHLARGGLMVLLNQTSAIILGLRRPILPAPEYFRNRTVLTAPPSQYVVSNIQPAQLGVRT